MNIQQINAKLDTIKAFLAARGAEVLIPTSQWEVLRFRAGDVTSIVYRNAQDQLNLTGQSQAALKSFFNQTPWRAMPKRKRTRSNKRSPLRVAELLARDGDCCFLCGGPLGDDITEEHLVAVTHGGPNHIANMALAHCKCNLQMHHLSVMEKIALRDWIMGRPVMTGPRPDHVHHTHNAALHETTGAPHEH